MIFNLFKVGKENRKKLLVVVHFWSPMKWNMKGMQKGRIKIYICNVFMPQVLEYVTEKQGSNKNTKNPSKWSSVISSA